jgi:hypothetical protein
MPASTAGCVRLVRLEAALAMLGWRQADLDLRQLQAEHKWEQPGLPALVGHVLERHLSAGQQHAVRRRAALGQCDSCVPAAYQLVQRAVPG